MARSRVCTAPAYREGPRLRACAGARRSAWLYGSHRAGCGAQCCRELAPEWEESMRTGSTATGRRLPQEQLPSDRSCARRHEGHLSGGAAPADGGGNSGHSRFFPFFSSLLFYAWQRLHASKRQPHVAHRGAAPGARPAHMPGCTCVHSSTPWEEAFLRTCCPPLPCN